MDSHLKVRINRFLGERGLGQLDDPGLLGQLGFLVRDHDHLRSLLVTCVPEERRNMYDALAPNLRFKPRLLDEYIAEAKADAEARQLPTIEPDGSFKAYKVPEVVTENIVLEGLLTEAVAKVRLDVTCRKCTKAESFFGTDKYEAVKAARDAGWVYSWIGDGEGVEICPSCP